jgi:hypothetical protein
MADIIKLAERRPVEPETRGPMCEVHIYDNGDVTVWLSNEIADVDQFNWLFAKLAGATGALFDTKREATGKE